MAVTPLHEERTRDDLGYATPSRAAVPLLTLALQLLDERILLWAVVLGAGVVWGFTVAHPELWRIVAASLYSVLVLLPILLTKGRS